MIIQKTKQNKTKKKKKKKKKTSHLNVVTNFVILGIYFHVWLNNITLYKPHLILALGKLTPEATPVKSPDSFVGVREDVFQPVSSPATPDQNNFAGKFPSKPDTFLWQLEHTYHHLSAKTV